jgi:hypothetical protein
VITKESLIRRYFSLSAPIKYACGCIVYVKETELEWLVQCSKGPEVPGSIPGGRHFFAVRYFCMRNLHGAVHARWLAACACWLASLL